MHSMEIIKHLYNGIVISLDLMGNLTRSDIDSFRIFRRINYCFISVDYL